MPKFDLRRLLIPIDILFRRKLEIRTLGLHDKCKPVKCLPGWNHRSKGYIGGAFSTGIDRSTVVLCTLQYIFGHWAISEVEVDCCTLVRRNIFGPKPEKTNPVGA